MHLFNEPCLWYRTANVGLLVAAKSPCFGLGLEGLVLVNISVFRFIVG